MKQWEICIIVEAEADDTNDIIDTMVEALCETHEDPDKCPIISVKVNKVGNT